MPFVGSSRLVNMLLIFGSGVALIGRRLFFYKVVVSLIARHLFLSLGWGSAARLDKLRSSALTPGGRSEGDRWAGLGRDTLRFAIASLADDRLTLVKARFAGLIEESIRNQFISLIGGLCSSSL